VAVELFRRVGTFVKVIVNMLSAARGSTTLRNAGPRNLEGSESQLLGPRLHMGHYRCCLDQGTTQRQREGCRS
jgi:hypothetical protein